MTLDQRTRHQIQTLAGEVVGPMKDAPELFDTPAGLFLSGIVTGLTAAVQIADGDSAEKAMERITARLEASIGRAYLDGKLPAPPAVDGPTLAEDIAADRNHDIRQEGE